MMEPSDDFSDAATTTDDAAAAVVVVDTSPPLLMQRAIGASSSSSSKKYEVAQHRALDERDVPPRQTDRDDSDLDEFHDSESDAGASNYVVVKKSIFKESKRGSGLLSRLKDASTLRSPARNKYIPTTESVPATAAVVTPQTISRRRADLEAAEPQITIATHVVDDTESDISRQGAQASAAQVASAAPTEDNEDDGSDITVAIQATVAEPPAAQVVDLSATVMVALDESEDFGAAPQVVIHSGESDSDSTGFAMLNPVIGSSASRRYRSTVPLASSGSFTSMSAATLTGGSTAAAVPCLQEIPALSSSEASAAASAGDHKLVLVVHALGASGLAKVEKFGTQSTFLEMRVCNSDDAAGGGVAVACVTSGELPSPAPGSSVMRTALHKKGGSDAQWNQQFSMPLRAKDAQFLHLAVRTHGKAVVGDARVSLADVPSDGVLYDQHYTLYRRLSATAAAGASSRMSDDANDCAESIDDVEAGLVHLQLQIVDPTSIVSSAVPLLLLPYTASSSSGYASQVNNASSAVQLPPVLRNGALLFKVPFHSRSLGSSAVRRQWVAVSASGNERGGSNNTSGSAALEITWCDPTARADDRKSVRSLSLALVTEVREGHRTKAFERQLQSAGSSSVVHERDKCFSLVSKSRTLDLVASCKEEARVWVSALRELLFPSRGDVSSDSVLSARVIEDYKLSALSPRHGASAALSPDKAFAYAAPLANSKAQLAAWRSTIFDLARRSRTQEISECLHAGCPIDLLEPGEGDTVLMIACRLGHVQLVELCLLWRAKNDPHPEFGETALQAAVNASHAECVALLLSTAAKSDMDSEIVNHINSNNDAPLHVAARHGDLACLQLLLHHGADICVVEEFGRTPLHCAVSHGHLDCVAYLLDVGGDSVLNAGDHDGDTALHYAALAGNEVIVKLLLESAANVFSANAQGETPYDIALREKQQACAFLISQYYLTNTKESPTPSSHPAPRNEAASTLLLRRQQQELDGCSEDEGEGVNDRDDGDEDDASEHSDLNSDSDSSVTYASRSPQRSRGYERQMFAAQSVLEQYRRTGDVGCADDGDESGYQVYGVPLTERHLRHAHRFSASHAAANRLALSPSDQVREALLRSQSLRAPPERAYRGATLNTHSHQRLQHRFSAASIAPTGAAAGGIGSSAAPSYYSAHEPSPYYPSLASSSSSRGAFTERIDRHKQFHSGFGIARDPPYSYQDTPELYAYARQHAAAGHSYNDEMHYSYAMSQDDSTRWDDARDSYDRHRYHQVGRRSNSMDMAMNSHLSAALATAAVHPMRAAWESGSAHSDCASAVTPPVQQHQQQQQATITNPLWDKFYTQDGYPYYVHRVTGVSQWEPPVVPPPPPSTAAFAQSRAPPNAAASVLEPALAPDSLIRMRLAEARKQHSSSNVTPLATSEAVAVAPGDSLPGVVPAAQLPVERQMTSDPPLPPPPVAVVEPATSPPPTDADAPTLTIDFSLRNTTPASAISTTALVAAVVPPASPPVESKFQARTGFKLSVDVSSPTRMDETRPVFVPSPRSRSPSKTKSAPTTESDPLDSPSYSVDGSFQKSRPSSPRGKSKTIQLIELKRANNLALALASFKIQDQQQYEQVVNAIASMSDRSVNAELLVCLQRFFPTEDERQLLQAFGGPIARLGKAEQFFYLLLQVPRMHERIDMLLYKLEFARTHRSLLAKIQVVKRACRDLLENYSFLHTLEEFFRKHKAKRFSVLESQQRAFASEFLPRVDEKFRSFRDDLDNARGVELMDVQIQLNRFVAGIRSIQVFVDKHAAGTVTAAAATDERDLAACGVLQLFLVETRGAVTEIESEYESMGAWEEKLLDAFGESRASCQLSGILECVARMLRV